MSDEELERDESATEATEAAEAAEAADSPAAPDNPFARASSTQKSLTLIGVYVAILGSIMHSATVSTLLPVAAADIGGMDYYSLANTLPGIVSVVCMPLWGYFGAKSPSMKRPLFCISMLIGAAVLIIRSVALNMMVIAVSSVGWGVVSCGVFVLGYAMIREIYDAKKAATYLGICGTMMCVAMLVGPTVGGIVMDTIGWRWLCHIIWPFLVVSAVLIFFGAKASKEEAAGMAVAAGKFDTSGAISLVVFLGALITAVSLGTSLMPFGSLVSNLLFVLAAIGLVALIVVIARKKGAAIVPATALRHRNVLGYFLSNFFCSFSNMAVFFFLPMYVLTAMGGSATQAGLVTTLLSVVGVFMGPIFGRMIGKAQSGKGVISFGAIMRIVCAVALLIFLAPNASIFIIYVIMFVAGFYNSIQGTAYASGPQVQLPASIRVQGNSVVQLGQNFGSAIGTAVFTAVLTGLGVVGGMPVALAISIVAAACGLVGALMLNKKKNEEL